MSILILKVGETVSSLQGRRGDFEDWFRTGLGVADAPCIDARGSDPLPPASDFAGVVITGAASMVTDREAWSEAAGAWCATAHADGVPLLGVCYGHQLLAHVLGGEAGWNPNGREIGTVEVELLPAADDDALLGGLASPMLVQTTHSQSVLRLPDGARHLARNAHDELQSFALGERTWGVQFHPEMDADIIRGYLSERAEEIGAEGIDAEQRRALTRDSEVGTTILRRFASICGVD